MVSPPFSSDSAEKDSKISCGSMQGYVILEEAGLTEQPECAGGTVVALAKLEKNQSGGIRKEQWSVTTTCKNAPFWGLSWCLSSALVVTFSSSKMLLQEY